MQNMLLGGDQLTVARSRAAIKVKLKPSCRLEGLTPTIKDWHAKQTIFEVNLKLMSTMYMLFFANKSFGSIIFPKHQLLSMKLSTK
jgi:hypothetical protein